jgi:D-tyrosyl-tRNA(Tyr) deacylase
MRILAQRVLQASVQVEGETVGAIGAGLLLLVGIGHGDDEAIVRLLADRIVGLRCFADEAGKTNLSLLDTGGEALVVSQFTLYADLRRGRRPGFGEAAEPGLARQLVEQFGVMLRERGVRVAAGVFGADMQVSLVNDGPFTLWLDSAIFDQPRHPARG